MIYHLEKSTKKNKTPNDSGWRLSAVDRDANLSLNVAGLAAQVRGVNAWQGCRTNRGVKKVQMMMFLTVSIMVWL